MKTAVVIPNWNGMDTIRACLDSLGRQSQDHLAIVVDNGSSDGSVSLIQQRYPDAKLIAHTRNKGFAGGVNAGIKSAIGQGMEYVALLNNDATVDKDWLRHLETYMESNPQTGIATCKLITMDKSQLDSTGEWQG